MTNTDIVARLIERANQNLMALAVYNPLLREAAKEIKTLRAERDEARREACIAEAMLSPRDDQTPSMCAAERGWDCFKENTDD